MAVNRYGTEASEAVCGECLAGDHEACRREGGFMDDERNDPRCGCHLTGHALDRRPRLLSAEERDRRHAILLRFGLRDK